MQFLLNLQKFVLLESVSVRAQANTRYQNGSSEWKYSGVLSQKHHPYG